MGRDGAQLRRHSRVFRGQVIGDSLYLYGGYGGNGRLDDFFQYNFRSREWTAIEPRGDPPCARENNGVVVRGRCLYLFGGYNGTTWLNDFHEFDIDTHQWREIRPKGGSAPAPRFGYVSAIHRDSFIIFGGYDGATWLNDMHEYSFTTGVWTAIRATGDPPSIRSCPSWTTKHGCIYVFGGYDGIQRMNDFFEFDMGTHTWREIHASGTPPSPRYFHACSVHGEALYVFGGYNGSERLNDLFRYDFEGDRWSQVVPKGSEAPDGRSSLVAEVHGVSLFLFGGYNGHTVLNDFHEFRLEAVVVPAPSLVADLGSMVNNAELSDVTFLVEGSPVYASRCHLAARSDHFRAMLFGGMREATGEREITVSDVSRPVFLKIMEFLYTDRVTGLSMELAMPLLMAAEQYLLERLKCLCEDEIRKNIATDNVVHLFMAAHRYRALGLKDVCLEYILGNLEATKKTQGFQELRGEPELLMEIIMRQGDAQ